MILIISRGPAGSGKSEVWEKLKNKIKEHKSIESCFLNLDEIDPEKFESNMKEALECECVISEMFSGEDKKSPGNGHTTNPETWIDRFKDKNYNIFSFILKASVDTCLQRCKNDENKNRSEKYEKEHNLHEDNHWLFYKDLQSVDFAKNAGIPEEIIDTETKSIPEVVDIIYSKIKSYIT